MHFYVTILVNFSVNYKKYYYYNYYYYYTIIIIFGFIIIIIITITSIIDIIINCIHFASFNERVILNY